MQSECRVSEMDCRWGTTYCHFCNKEYWYWARDHVQLQLGLERRSKSQVRELYLSQMPKVVSRCQCGAENCSGFLGADSVLWRKTAQLDPLQRTLLEEALTSSESCDVSLGIASPTESVLGDSVLGTDSRNIRRLRNRLQLHCRSVMTRSKV